MPKPKTKSLRPPKKNAEEPSFPFIAIGASAGGLEALGAFFENVPEEMGTAFVVIQHLSPRGKSLLGEILKKHTRLEILELQDGMRAQPGHIYLNPPGKDVTIVHSVFHLKDQAEAPAVRLPIDHFFRSLAQDQLEKSICIILSGTGSDGTLQSRLEELVQVNDESHDELQVRVQERTAELAARNADLVAEMAERKRAEADLGAAEELARQRLLEIEDIYRNAPVGLCVLDRDLRFVRINERLAEINGLPASEHIGKTLRELLPELTDTVEPEMRRILETGAPRLNIEIVGETPAQSGVKRSWMEQWLPIIDAHGQVAGLNVVVEETTERMRLLGEIERTRDELEARVIMRTAELAQTNAELQETARALVGSEEKLRRNIELLQKVFDGITDPLIMLDGSGLVTMINRAAVSYYGVDETKDIFDKPCFEALRGRETACPECPYPFPSVGASTLNFQRNGLNDPGTVESITVYPVIKEHGGRDAVIVRISDITQAKILEKQILQNEKLAALGLMTSGIAHEVNNPNSFIYFNLPILRSYLEELMPIVDEHAAQHPDFEVLNMPYGDLREDIFRLLENMEHGSQRISKTIGVLKSFVRGRDQEGVQRVDLKELIEKVVALCRTDLRQKLGSFEIMVPDNLPTIVSDPEAIEQVLMNLLINAIQACDKPDSHVSLKVRHDVSGVGGFVMEITDNGPGIEGTVRERIFDPFFTTKPPNQGTGLGLYICHSHVTSLGGRIEVESRVGEGTTFRVVLPVNFRHVMEGALQDQA